MAWNLEFLLSFFKENMQYIEHSEHHYVDYIWVEITWANDQLMPIRVIRFTISSINCVVISKFTSASL